MQKVYHLQSEKQQIVPFFELKIEHKQESNEENHAQNLIQSSLLQNQYKFQYQIVINRNHPLNKINTVLRTTKNLNYKNFFFINEQILKGSPNYDYSFSENVFQYRKANKIILTNDYLRAYLSDRNTPKIPLGYLIQRLKSMGDYKFNQLANIIEKLDSIIDKVSIIMLAHKYYYSDELLEEKLLNFKNKPYFVTYTTYENNELSIASLIFSKALINMLGYNPQQLAIKFTRLGAVRGLNIFSNNSIPQMSINYITSIYEYHKRIIDKGFSPDIWKQLIKNDRTMRIQFTMKTGQKQVGDMRLIMPTPFFGVFQLIKISNKQKLFGYKSFPANDLYLEYKNEDPIRIQKISSKQQFLSISSKGLQHKRMILDQEKALLKIVELPENTLVHNQKRVSGYRNIQKSVKN